jgi:ATP-dependent Lhr-like helicase
MLPAQLDDVLGELVTRGWITADGFAGLRTLISERSPRGRSAAHHRGQRRRTTRTSLGRWSLRVPFQVPAEAAASPVAGRSRDRATLEHWAWQLLRRWGIVFRDLLAREEGSPPWFEILQVLRRLEARGEIRGGRFILGVGGEQFALPDAIQHLRRLRDETPPSEWIVISAADPLNLAGVVTDHARIPRSASNRLAYIDGNLVATLQAGEVTWLSSPSHELKERILERLLGRDSGRPAAEEFDGQRVPLES